MLSGFCAMMFRRPGLVRPKSAAKQRLISQADAEMFRSFVQDVADHNPCVAIDVRALVADARNRLAVAAGGKLSNFS